MWEERDRIPYNPQRANSSTSKRKKKGADISYWFALRVSIPVVKPVLTPQPYDMLHLGELDAADSMVDVAVHGWKLEQRRDGPLKVVLVQQELQTLPDVLVAHLLVRVETGAPDAAGRRCASSAWRSLGHAETRDGSPTRVKNKKKKKKK